MSILAHPEWGAIRLFLRPEAYDRDTSHDGHVRRRIEVIIPDNAETRIWLLATQVPCPQCGELNNPIRRRAVWGTWYYSVSCPLDVRIGCSRSHAAAEETNAIVADLEGNPPRSSSRPQIGLFD